MKKLTTMQQTLYDTLQERQGRDVLIQVMYTRLYGPADKYTSVRDMQQKMANIIARINRNIAPWGKIEPGEIKKTYRLTIDYTAR